MACPLLHADRDVSHTGSLTHWIGFSAFLVVMLVLDLVVLHRGQSRVSTRSALAASAGWIALGLAVGAVIGWRLGRDAFVEYLTAYVIEESLSIDNLFVFALMFTAFRIPPEHQHRVLFWGIFGALVMRAGFIFAGVALLARFHWIMYVFGGVLLVAAVRIGRARPDAAPEHSLMLRWIGRFLRTTPELHGRRFLIRDAATGALMATPLLAVLIALETTDIAFAVDSIPAVLGVTTDSFLVFTSNAMAILGLRSLYFVIAAGLDRLRHLKTGLSVILAFIAVKMLAHDVVHIPAAASLGVIVLILAVTALASLRGGATLAAPKSSEVRP
jgi:tellurite resistance protein TerC